MQAAKLCAAGFCICVSLADLQLLRGHLRPIGALLSGSVPRQDLTISIPLLTCSHDPAHASEKNPWTRTCARHFSHASASAARHAFKRAMSWRHSCTSSFSGRYLLRYSVLNCCSVVACSSRTWTALHSLQNCMQCKWQSPLHFCWMPQAK